MVLTVQKVHGWYEKSMERNVHGTKSPPMVRNVYGTKSLWYEKSGNPAYYCIIMWALKSEISKERSMHLRLRHPHCHSETSL